MCGCALLLQFPEILSLNVGGTFFTTRLSTLRRHEDTMLAAMFSGRYHIPQDADGRYFIDRDGHYFGDILNFLREGELPPQELIRAVHREAQYYSIGPLLEQLEDMQPLTGEKVRQAFLDLLPYYRGTARGARARSGRISVCTKRRCPSRRTSARCLTLSGSSARTARLSSLSTTARWTCLSDLGRLWPMSMTCCTVSSVTWPRLSDLVQSYGCVTHYT
uniref:BTB/POZ domain-containing protein KCTD7 n=1 Tax=Neogobius melanostomus TaxID=47308 RepID=A0A8C6S4S7_9GOBI